MMRDIPAAALWLGFAGALPFIAGLVGVVAPTLAVIDERATLTYGAVILSFLGGVHWGLAMAERTDAAHLCASVVPALIGWLATLIGGGTGLFLLAAAFAGLLAFDILLARGGAAPVWYPALRWPLTIIVVACLALTGVLYGDGAY